MSRLTLLQRFYLFLHHLVFNRRLKEQIRFSKKFVISIGNISAGGTGKTPVGLWLAENFKSAAPLVVLRGYGGSLAGKTALVFDGVRRKLTAQAAGDEALLYCNHPGVKVAVGARRADVIRQHGVENKFIILDDAFQNPRVFRNFDLVLLDARIEPAEINVFPVGRFREGLEALQRADAILLTRCSEAKNELRRTWEELLAVRFPGKKVFSSNHVPVGVVPDLDQPGLKLGAFSGIAGAESFITLLHSVKIVPVIKFAFKDHHNYSPAELREFVRLSQSEGINWITTEKDYVRLQDRPDLPPGFLEKLHYIQIKIEILDGREKELLELIEKSYSTLLEPGNQ